MWNEILVLSVYDDPMNTSLYLLHSIMFTWFFDLQLKSLFILNFVSGFLKVYDFP